MFGKFKVNKLAGLATGFMAAVHTEIALAQSKSGWESGIKDKAEDFKLGLIDIGIMLIGFGIIIYALYMVFTGRLEPQQLAVRVFAGILMVFGPPAFQALLT